MSKAYSIGCRDCREHLWIAQTGILYTGEPHTMEALKAFLFKHAGHNLVFDDHINSEMIDWNEIKPNPQTK